MSINLLDTVALTVDMPEHGLRSGDVGAVVQIYSATAIEVEFVTSSGSTRALVTLSIDTIRPVGARKGLSAHRPDAA